MKIKLSELKQIIKEEVNLMLEYEQYVYRRPDGELWVKDDDGNNEPAPHLDSEYSHLEAGGDGETIFGSGRRGGGSYGGYSGGRKSYRRRRRW